MCVRACISITLRTHVKATLFPRQQEYYNRDLVENCDVNWMIDNNLPFYESDVDEYFESRRSALASIRRGYS